MSARAISLAAVSALWKEIPDSQKSTYNSQHIIINEEDFLENYGINADQFDRSDKLIGSGVRELANQEGVQEAKETARRMIDGLCYIKEDTIEKND